MRYSSREKKALKMMLVIATHSRIKLSDIIMQANISVCTSERLSRALREAGLIVSIPGKDGGYQLSRAPEEISIGSIIEAINDAHPPKETVDTFPLTETPAIQVKVMDLISGFETMAKELFDGLFLKDIMEMEEKDNE